MKVSVSTWSFSRSVQSDEMSQLDVIDAVAELGFDSIEFAKFLIPEEADPLRFAETARERCDALGLEVVAYAIGADFIGGCGGDLDAEVRRLESEVEIAVVLGAPLMRHDVAYRPKCDRYTGTVSFDSYLPRIAEGVSRVTEYAKTRGIRTASENHGLFVQDSARVEKLVNAVGNANFGVLLDIGNFVCADEDPAAATGVLLPYLFHVHAKDFYLRSGMLPDPGAGWSRTRGGNRFRGCIVGHGDVPVAQCLGLIKRSGYDGIISIEYEGYEPPILGVSEGRANLRRLWELS